MSRARKKFKELLAQNNIAFHSWYKQVQLISTTMFEWTNLPNGIPEKFIEETLYNWGLLAFYHHSIFGYMICKASPSGKLNFYDEPVSYRLYGHGINEITVNRDEIVLLRNNKMELPTVDLTYKYIMKLYNVERAIDTNIELQKYSAVVKCNEKEKLTFENLLMKHEGNYPVIMATKDLDLSNLETLNFNVPFLADKLQEHMTNTWRLLMSMLGINNANTEKKERLITDEVNANNDFLDLSRDIFLSERIKFCEEVKEKFNIEINVERRGDNGTLYNDLE